MHIGPQLWEKGCKPHRCLRGNYEAGTFSPELRSLVCNLQQTQARQLDAEESLLWQAIHLLACPPACRKETHCEFCDSLLPDWKSTLTPPCGADAPAVMNVNFDGKTYSFEVKPGPAGQPLHDLRLPRVPSFMCMGPFLGCFCCSQSEDGFSVRRQHFNVHPAMCVSNS